MISCEKLANLDAGNFVEPFGFCIDFCIIHNVLFLKPLELLSSPRGIGDRKLTASMLRQDMGPQT